MDGALPVNPSGGLLGANPIGAAGLVRFAEAALQVRGTAGEHQVDDARLALGHAAGGYSNCVAMWIVGRDRPETKSAGITSRAAARVLGDDGVRSRSGVA
jgi:acetyl-CoA C-acetyltransferase